MSSREDGKFQLYKYTPNVGASVLFIVLFSLGTIIITYQVYFHAIKLKRKLPLWGRAGESEQKNLRFLNVKEFVGAYVPLLVGCLLEVIGYIGRAVSNNNREKLAPYILQSVLLLIAPTFFAASIYMIFGRMARLVFAESYVLLPTKINTTTYVLADIFSLLIQASGGGLMASKGSATTGSHLATAGLFIQIGTFGIFVLNEIFFIWKVRNSPSNMIATMSRKWVFLNFMLFANSILILLRSIVRAIEFIQGYSGQIASHEFYIYVFDALPMFLLVASFSLLFYYNNLLAVNEESLKIQLNIDKTAMNDIEIVHEDSYEKSIY